MSNGYRLTPEMCDKIHYFGLFAIIVIFNNVSFSSEQDVTNYSVPFPRISDPDELQTNDFPHITLFMCQHSDIKVGDFGFYNISRKYFLEHSSSLDNDGVNDTLLIRLLKSDPDCDSGSRYISVQPSIEDENGTSNGHILGQNGWLIKYYNQVYLESIPRERYCISDLDNEGNFTVQYCQSDCQHQPCISKCCFSNEVCDIVSDDGMHRCACTDSGAISWTSTMNQFSTRGYSYVHHLFNCDYHFTLNEKSTNLNFTYENAFRVDGNGQTHFRRLSDGIWTTLTQGSYCIDGAVKSRPGEIPAFSGDRNDMVLFVCSNEDSFHNEQHDFIIYQILVPFAAIFIVLTIIVYLLTWSEQNVHGYTIFFYLVTLLLLYLFIVLSMKPSISHPVDHPISCGFIAAAIHFFYLSSTCWLTSVSYDVFRTFQKMHLGANRSRGLRRFSMYTLFSFGYPLVQVIVCAVLDGLYRKAPQSDVPFILPNYGYGGKGCNMSNDGITFYLYIPISVLLASNCGFFIATIIIMKIYKRSIREAFAGIHSSANNKVNQSFGIYARLFIIMGLFWVTQMVSWFVLVHYANSPAEKSLDYVFAITDALTVLQAVLIFYIFVCKQAVFTNLWNLQPWLRPFLKLWIFGGCCNPPSRDVRVIPSRESRPTSGNPTLATTVAINSRKESTDTYMTSRTNSTDSGRFSISSSNPMRQTSLEDKLKRKISGISNNSYKMDGGDMKRISKDDKMKGIEEETKV